MEELYHEGLISDLDYRFGQFIGRLDGCGDHRVMLAAALVSRQRAEGHICLDLRDVKDVLAARQESAPPHYPPPDEWRGSLEGSKAIGRPGDFKPIILDGSRLYLCRYWQYENRLAGRLKAMTADARFEFDEKLTRRTINELFGRDKADRSVIDRQKLAAFAAVRNRLCVISGGPGTGKTFTVAKILALLTAMKSGGLRISLAAPTGKAAARLQAAVKDAKALLTCSDEIKNRIPEEASTLHRLLGALPNTPRFRHDADHPLPADCLVVDEASMVDLALFAKVVDALKDGARLILLGDKDQLASVEAGAVLGDICDAGERHGYSKSFRGSYQRITGEVIEEGGEDGAAAGPLADSIVELTKSYRFAETSGIGALSAAVNAGDPAGALGVARSGKYADLCWRTLPAPDSLVSPLSEWAVDRFRDWFGKTDPAEALARQPRCRILCVLREGPYGVVNLNGAIEKILIRAGVIGRPAKWYHGRPIMITKNDYSLGLFNGDTGIAMADGMGNLKVFFAGSDGRIRSFAPSVLPDHETVYALTVHKSQGSEYDDVLFITADRETPLLTRELIYTAVTRAARRLEIWGRSGLFLNAVERRIHRSSGLRQALWPAPDF